MSRSPRPVGSLIEDAPSYLARGTGWRERRCAGEVVEVVAFGVRQAHGTGQPVQHLAGQVRAAGLIRSRRLRRKSGT